MVERGARRAELIAVSDVPFEVMAQTREGWDVEFTQVEAGHNPTNLCHLELGGLSIGNESIPRSVIIRGAIPLGTINMAIPNSPDTALTFRGRTVSTDTIVYQRPFAAVDAQYGGALANLAVDPRVLEDHMGREAVASALNSDQVELPPRDAARLRDLCRQALRAFRARPDLMAAAPLACARLRIQVLDQIQSVLERTLHSRKTPGARVDIPGRMQAAKRADEYARRNLGRPISLRDLTRRTGVSERTLRTGFVERFGHSPKRHLIMLQLNAARAALRNATPGETSVTEVAMEHGFWHLSRFAQAYRRHFGELPSESLRATPG